MSGLPLTSSDLRAEVMAQPAAERLEYALDYLDYLFAPPEACLKTAADLGIKDLPPSALRILHRLALSAGRVVTFEALAAAADRCDRAGDRNTIMVLVSRLRSQIRAAGCPIIIEAHRGFGYRLEAPPELPMPRQRP
jgi:DNA-binding response OmpR family regulator